MNSVSPFATATALVKLGFAAPCATLAKAVCGAVQTVIPAPPPVPDRPDAPAEPPAPVAAPPDPVTPLDPAVPPDPVMPPAPDSPAVPLTNLSYPPSRPVVTS